MVAHNFGSRVMRVRPHTPSGRNFLYIVETSGATRRFLAKQVSDASRAETWFYSEIGHDYPFVPTPFVVDTNANTVILEYVEGRTIEALTRHDPALAVDRIAALATPLALLHSRVVDHQRAPTARVPLPPFDPVDVDLLLQGGPATLDFIARVQAQPRLSECLAHALESPGPYGLIHGDLKADNVVLRALENQIPASADRLEDVVILDWELCGVGPLAWDLGALVGSMVVIWSYHLQLDAGSDPGDWVANGLVPFDTLHGSVTALVGQYLETAENRGSPMPTRRALAMYTAAWIVSRQLVASSEANSLTAHQLLLLIIAETIYTNPWELFGDLSW